ncbi:MAG: alcohol dehydrogenase, partial [Deltaproteobacteria bacterium]
MRALVCELSVPRQVVTSLLGRIDKRFFFGPFSPATLRELPEPELPAPDWVTIRTRLCGICGSDYKQMFLNGSMDNPMTAVISFPQVLGHEVVGTIERVGPAVRTRRVGERVVLNP